MHSELELKSCPFCGGAPEIKGFVIGCPNKDCWGPSIRHIANREDAIAAWNRREASTQSTGGSEAPQCCICGKKGLSTVEGNGGTECQLEDGRWTCSADCYWHAADILENGIPPGGSEAVGVLARLRGEGWSVAVHNDFYRLNGEAHTFWLLIHPSGRWVRGEGRTDDEALAAVSRSALTQPEGIAARDAVIEEQVQAADLIVSQEAEIAKLREALKPFAEKLGYILVPADDQDVSPWTTAPDATPVINVGSYGLTFGDFRRASLALSENSDDKG